MANLPKIFSTLILIVTVALTANAENHPTKFETFKEKEQSKDAVNPSDYRLPKSIVPESYDIIINNVDFDKFTFDGTSVIHAQIKEDTKEIVLNAGSINVVVESVYENGLKREDFETKPNETTELYKIIFKEKLHAEGEGVVIITLNFNGKLRDDMIGFYKSSYFNDKNEQKWLAATQFESTHARHAFPCFDEPEFKAVFEIAIQVPKGYSCLSNMKFISENNLCRFEKSQKMSTYLVAFVISDFKPGPINDDRLKLWARPNALAQTVYGQQIGVDILEKLGNLFGEDYYNTMKKMDMVAVPDFSAGAMENWGLITYRETAGLYDADHSPDVAKQRVASVIVHECTHMWFGNLVTPEWWSYLWLSEAFARYYQYMGTDLVEENWKMDEQFVVEQFQTAMAVDSVEDSKPMTRPEGDLITPAQIATAGGSITYNKGASIVRMMEKTFGTKEFYAALKNYIQERKLKSARPDHLWKSLQKEVDPELVVADIMKTWTEQAGYPYITVTVEPNRIKLTQARFLLRHVNDVPKNLWQVPITFSSSSKPSESTKPESWLTKQEDEIERDNSKDDWLILNVQSAGFYRVNYDTESWNKIIKLLTTGDFSKIHVANRAAIVDDLLNLARAEIVDYELVFKALQYLKKETHYLPFKSALTGLDYLTRVTAEGPDYEFLKTHILSLIKTTYDKVTFDDKLGDDRLTILLRQELNSRVCGFDDKSCVDKALKYFDEWKKNRKSVPKNQRSAVYCTAIRHGKAEDWEFLYKQYRETNVAAEEVTILGALGCSEDTKILEKYLNNALSGFETSGIRSQDIASVFSGVYTASLKNAEFMIDYADNNYDILYRYHKKYEAIGGLITAALQRYPIKRLADKVDKLVEAKGNAAHIKPNLASIRKSRNFVDQEINLFNKNLPPAIDSVKESDPSIENTDTYRLLGNVVPSHYEIHLEPHISPKENFTFDGLVKITAKVVRTVKNITLHSDLMTISSVKVTNINDEKNPVNIPLANSKPARREKYHFTDIAVESPIFEDTNILIEIKYKGTLSMEMRGFYRSSYRNQKKETRWLAATHLEPTGARRVFPCFDEPALKATFSISVQAPDGYTAISNTKLKSNDKGLFKFETTPRMSTYLVAVVVSDFSSKTDNDKKHEYAVYANPLVINQVDYALKVMGPITQWFEDKLGHDYSLKKLDMIALPDFTSGAMENWGLMTFRETNLLFDPTTMSSLANMQSIRNVIAHEITHQWFGDLVSPLWWDYTWLNEGFARYFQAHAYTKDESTWNLETQFVVDHLQTSFATDGSTGTHPITVKVYSPSEIRGIFDKISYAKAASIIRMLEKLTGPDIFYSALNKYLAAREFDTATPEALFAAFQTEIDKDKNIEKFNVTKLMNSWTLKEGFPVLNVKFEDDDAVAVSQTRFYQRQKTKRDESPTWVVPLSWATKSKPNFADTREVTWVQGQKQAVVVKREKDDWVIFNKQQMGYFRVNYDEKMWKLIIKALDSTEYTKIHEINRANIIDDLLHLGRAGQVSYDLVLSGLSYLARETEYAPWKAAFTGLVYLNRRFAGRPEVYDSYREFLLRLLEPSFKRLEFDDKDGDKPTDILLRQQVLNWLCSFGHEECVKEALAQFKKEQNSADDKYIVAPNKRSYVYCTAIKKGTEKEWNYLWQKYVESDYATEKVAILGALACSQNPELLNRLMDETLKENSEIRLQNAKTVFTNIVNAGLIGVETVMDYIPSHFGQMSERLGDESIAKSTLNTISKRVSTNQLLKKFGEVVEKSEKTMPGISKFLQSYNKRAKEEMNWFKEKTPKIFEWIETENIKKKAQKPENSDYRLPTSVEPEAYELFLTPDFDTFTFAGNVIIDIKIKTQTPSIVFHYHGLNIKDEDIVVEDKEEKTYKISSTQYNSVTQKLTLFFGNMLEENASLQLKIKFDGVLRDDMRGFYKSSYIDDKKETKWLASTHFEPTYARRAFPCFDEPSFKAYFTLHISTPKGYHVISNRGSKPEQVPDGERMWNHFTKSLKMSPYLLAFVVSQYEKTSDPKLSTRVAAWSRPQLSKYMKYAVPTGEAALQFLENFTDFKYPLDEMNFASIPDFDMGAMENWGLVTFREYGLTYDQKLTSATYKRYVNTVISHELVHQWFGNLVTCAWWDYTWLNEGFAEYVSYLISAKSEPNWQLQKQFVTKELHVGLESDSSESSHPMNNKVFTPNEAQDGFDRIAYQKSASVLRMLHQSFGNDVFVDAIRSYLKARSYNYAHPEDLYKAMEERMSKETKKPGNLATDVTTVMKSWTDQAGYPVVRANRGKDGKVTLVQLRFLIPSNASAMKVYYHVPITYTTESEKNFDNFAPKLWLYNEPQEIDVASKEKWFIVNVQQIGFYRVNYDLENWHALIDLLNSDKFTTIPDVNRAQLIDDTFNLARGESYGINYGLAFNASKYLARETDYLPWTAYFSATAYIGQRLEADQEIKRLYAKHVLTIIDKVYRKLGLKEDMAKDNHLDQLNRELISTQACKYGHEDCVDTASTYYKTEQARNSTKDSTITPNIATAVYCTAVEHGDSKVWEEVWEKYTNALLATDYLTILRGLGCSKDSKVLEKYLTLIIEPQSKIRRQDAGTAFSSVYTSSQIGLDTSLQFFIKNIDELYKFYGDWHDVGSLLTSMAGRIVSGDHIKILENLKSNKEAESIKSSVESAIKVANKNAKWFKENSILIKTWLEMNYEETKTTTAAPSPNSEYTQA